MINMKKIFIATANKDKIYDFQLFLNGEFEVLSLFDIAPNLVIEETGKTFEENALLKARAGHLITGGMVLADDSGICVDALDGRPNIYSARYAGNHDDEANKKKLLQELSGVPIENRTAHFVTCIAGINEKGEEFTVRGTLEGKILADEKGSNGFAYDTLFLVDKTNLTLAEMTNQQRIQYSHRNKAIQNMLNSQWFIKNRKQ